MRGRGEGVDEETTNLKERASGMFFRATVVSYFSKCVFLFC